jgi:hypothetical protein
MLASACCLALARQCSPGQHASSSTFDSATLSAMLLLQCSMSSKTEELLRQVQQGRFLAPPFPPTLMETASRLASSFLASATLAQSQVGHSAHGGMLQRLLSTARLALLGVLNHVSATTSTSCLCSQSSHPLAQASFSACLMATLALARQ